MSCPTLRHALITTFFALATPIIHAETDALNRVAWLAGCWVGDNAEAGSGEQWMPPAGGNLLGMSRSIKAGKTGSYEFMRIHVAADGKLLFTAQPSGKKEDTFTQLRLSDAEVVFENLEHEFPQRIIYRLDGNRLAARIEGMRQGTLRGIDYPMKRVNCEGLAGK